MSTVAIAPLPGWVIIFNDGTKGVSYYENGIKKWEDIGAYIYYYDSDGTVNRSILKNQ